MAEHANYTDAVTELISRALKDKFEEQNIDDDVLSALDGLEALGRKHVSLPPDVGARIHPLRKLGLQFAHDFMTLHLYEHNHDAAVDMWFEVASILDRDMTWLLAHTEGEASISVVLTWASSAVLLALGLEGLDLELASIRKALQSLASSYSVRLGGGEVEVIEIERSQHRLLKCLYRVPSVATWLSIYLERFRLCFDFVNPRKNYSLARLKSTAFGFAKRNLSSALSLELSHKQIAMSSLMMALFYSGLLLGDSFTQAVSVELHRPGLQKATLEIVFKGTMDEIEACAVVNFKVVSSTCDTSAKS